MPNRFDRDMVELFARQSFHEFLLEILHFNIFRNMPNPEAELNQFRNDLIDRIRNRAPAVQSPIPDPMVAVLKERMEEMAENFVLKVSKRMEG